MRELKTQDYLVILMDPGASSQLALNVEQAFQKACGNVSSGPEAQH